jgi:hypothetical protein
MVDPFALIHSREQGELFASIIKLNKCSNIIEIGVAWGTTTLYLCKAAEEIGAYVLGYDIWNYHGGLLRQNGPMGSQQEVEEYLKANKCNNFNLYTVDTYSIVFDNLLKRQFQNSKIDFAFIDGDHSYNGIKNDFFKVYPYMSERGIIAFHDTLRIDGCREFMIDLRTIYNDGTFDIIDFPWGNLDRRVGISILVKRTYPILGLSIDEKCESLSTNEEIYEKEKIWYNDEINRYKK